MSESNDESIPLRLDRPELIVPVAGVPTETFPQERRVALVPAGVGALKKSGVEVVVQKGAGVQAGFADELYAAQGARLVDTRAEVFEAANMILQVRAGAANPEAGAADIPLLKERQIVIASCDPLSDPKALVPFAERKAMLFSLEMMPRITRAQSMDVLSSMATIAGYKAVLLAADTLPRMFPMLMTAAGTLTPAKVFIMGAGVAGLQAIATAKRLGAVVQAYDVRPAVKEQCESLGAKFVETELKASDSEQKGGYAKQMDEEFYKRQREAMARVVAANNVVITTAAIPGKKAPVLVTAEMVAGMAPGSVIVDLAAERGGNCELTRAGETVVVNGVTIFGPVNLPSTIPYHASEMHSKNIATFVQQLVTKGKMTINFDDEVIRETLMTKDGEVVHSRIREMLGMPAHLEAPLAPGLAPGAPLAVPQV